MKSKEVFLIELHEIIKKYSEIRNDLLDPGHNIVWDEFKLTDDEVQALKRYQFDATTLTAIEKIVRDSILGAFHDAFALLDGVGDPEIVKIDEDDVWLGLRLTEPTEDEQDEDFLHDQVYSSYWDWLEQKNEK
jgi:hypothetical protein